MRNQPTRHIASGHEINHENKGCSDPNLVPDAKRLSAILDHPSFSMKKLEAVVSDVDVPQEMITIDEVVDLRLTPTQLNTIAAQLLTRQQARLTTRK